MFKSITRLTVPLSSKKQLRFESSKAAQLRRIKNRENWKFSFEDYDEDMVIFQERPGRIIEDNLVLSNHHVTTKEYTYRNLYTRGLLHFASGKLDQNKALHVETPSSSSRNALAKVKEEKKLINDLADSISESFNIFYFDRPIGAHSSTELKVRFITNCATTGLFLNNALSRYPQVSSSNFEPEFTVHIATEFDLESPETFNLTSKNFSLVHSEGISFGGKHAFRDILNDIFVAASKFVLEKYKYGNIPLRGTSILIKDKISLVIGDDKNLLSKNPTIVAHHHQFWTPLGLVPAWRGISLPFSENLKLTRGDLVETMGQEKFAHIQFVPPANFSSQPNTVVFLSNLGSPVTQLSYDEAALLFASGYDGKEFNHFFGSIDPSSDATNVLNGFKNLILQSKPEVYAVSPSSLDVITGSSKPKVEKPKANTFNEIKEYLSKAFPKLTL